MDEARGSSESADHGAYAAIVGAAASVVTCAHADPALVKLAARALSVEFRRWFEIEDGDDE